MFERDPKASPRAQPLMCRQQMRTKTCKEDLPLVDKDQDREHLEKLHTHNYGPWWDASMSDEGDGWCHCKATLWKVMKLYRISWRPEESKYHSCLQEGQGNYRSVNLTLVPGKVAASWLRKVIFALFSVLVKPHLECWILFLGSSVQHTGLLKWVQRRTMKMIKGLEQLLWGESENAGTIWPGGDNFQGASH